MRGKRDVYEAIVRVHALKAVESLLDSNDGALSKWMWRGCINLESEISGVSLMHKQLELELEEGTYQGVKRVGSILPMISYYDTGTIIVEE
jgi:hypothetical protein